MNLLSRLPVWVPVAYIPQVWADFQKSSAANAATARAQVLQHTLNLAFGDLMRASHFGVTVTMMDGTQGAVCPRAVLYVSDQPEERDIVCLKRQGTAFSCTPCMAPLSSCGRRSCVPHKKRNVLKMVGKQLKGAGMRGTYGTGVIIGAMEMKNSIHCIVRASRAWAGLGSGCLLLYQVFVFDRLHVRPPLRLRICPLCVLFVVHVLVMCCMSFCFVVCGGMSLTYR